MWVEIIFWNVRIKGRGEGGEEGRGGAEGGGGGEEGGEEGGGANLVRTLPVTLWVDCDFVEHNFHNQELANLYPKSSYTFALVLLCLKPLRENSQSHAKI